MPADLVIDGHDAGVLVREELEGETIELRCGPTCLRGKICKRKRPPTSSSFWVEFLAPARRADRWVDLEVPEGNAYCSWWNVEGYSAPEKPEAVEEDSSSMDEDED